MALVVDATPLGLTTNSYVSLEDMQSYVDDRVVDRDAKVLWASVSADLKAAYLVNATRFLDDSCTWIGDRYSRDQRLKWPRYNAYVDGWLLDQVTFPNQVVEATCEMALWMAQQAGETSVTQNAQFSALEVGPLRIDFNEAAGGSAKQYFPDVVAILLKDVGSIENPDLPSTSKLKVVRLDRA